MKIQIRFSDKPPISVDDVWELTIVVEGKTYTIVPQMADRDVIARILLRTLDLGDALFVIPHGSNSIRFGSGHG